MSFNLSSTVLLASSFKCSTIAFNASTLNLCTYSVLYENGCLLKVDTKKY